MNQSRSASLSDRGERGGVIVDAVLLVGTVVLVGIGAFHLLGGLMNDELAETADHRVLAFDDAGLDELPRWMGSGGRRWAARNGPASRYKR